MVRELAGGERHRSVALGREEGVVVQREGVDIIKEEDNLEYGAFIKQEAITDHGVAIKQEGEDSLEVHIKQEDI